MERYGKIIPSRGGLWGVSSLPEWSTGSKWSLVQRCLKGHLGPKLQCFPSNMWEIMVPQNGWFIMENPIKNGWFGGTIILGNTHVFGGPWDFLLVFLTLRHTNKDKGHAYNNSPMWMKQNETMIWWSPNSKLHLWYIVSKFCCLINLGSDSDMYHLKNCVCDICIQYE